MDPKVSVREIMTKISPRIYEKRTRSGNLIYTIEGLKSSPDELEKDIESIAGKGKFLIKELEPDKVKVIILKTSPALHSGNGLKIRSIILKHSRAKEFTRISPVDSLLDELSKGIEHNEEDNPYEFRVFVKRLGKKVGGNDATEREERVYRVTDKIEESLRSRGMIVDPVYADQVDTLGMVFVQKNFKPFAEEDKQFVVETIKKVLRAEKLFSAIRKIVRDEIRNFASSFFPRKGY